MMVIILRTATVVVKFMLCVMIGGDAVAGADDEFIYDRSYDKKERFHRGPTNEDTSYSRTGQNCRFWSGIYLFLCLFA